MCRLDMQRTEQGLHWSDWQLGVCNSQLTKLQGSNWKRVLYML